jgi:dipeptidyl aminopeptidase/acylaminoacyl peptidase
MPSPENSTTQQPNDPTTQRPKQRLTPKALLEIKRISEPRPHPDGVRVAFTVTEADFEESRWVSHLYLTEWAAPEREQEAGDRRQEETEAQPVGAMLASPHTQVPTPKTQEPIETPNDPTTQRPDDPTRQLTFSYDGESNPRWSPDGRYLAFVSSRPDESEPPPDDEEDDPKDQVWVLPMEGGEARRITNAKEGIIEYDWLPDSSALVYLASEPRPKPIESLRKEERTRRKIDPTVEHEEKQLKQFWCVDVEDKKPKLLFTADYGVQEFLLSPDGTRIAYTTNYTGEWNDYHKVDVFVRDLEGSGTSRKLITRDGGKYSPRWSPDGKKLAFLSWLDPKLSYSRQSLFMVDVPAGGADWVTPDGTDLQPLTPPEFDHDITEFAWSAHNGVIYAVTAEGTGSNVLRILPESGKSKAAFEDNNGDRRELYLDGHSTAFAFVQETVASPPEIWLRDDFGKVSQLTKLNAEFAETYALPRQEVVTWNSADGMPIEGILVRPLDGEDDKPAPLVVQVHGGPKGRAIHTLRGYYLHPVWATEGYAVLLPNFRGSEGYGQAFAIANRRDLGGGDFQDIMAGVDWCIAQGIADPERLGIMGGSYGGYMTNWAITQTNRFKAAISQFGIFHLQTDYSNSELSAWDNDYLGAYYWEDPEIYRKLSPGSYIERIKTPTLIMHGDDDTNTFISNSKELYQALRHRGVPTQFVHYPREGHGLQEPNHRLDELRRCLAWMDRYVRHDGQAQEQYRVGDRVPHPSSPFVLCIVQSEAGTYAGQPKNKEASDTATMLWEVALTLHRTEPQFAEAPLTLHLSEITLRGIGEENTQSIQPVGVPVEAHGGKYLLEGDNLRFVLTPDSETGELSLGAAVVFRVPKAGQSALLKVRDFPPIRLEIAPESEKGAGNEKADGEDGR